MVNYLEFQRFQVLQRFAVLRKFYTLRKLNVEDIDVQTPFRGDFGIQLPQRASSGVSGIGKQRLSFLFLPGIELFKALFRHEHFTTDDQPRRRIVNSHRDRVNGFQVFRNILTDITVSPGRAADKSSIHIFQSHRQSVNFRLHRKLGAALTLQHPVQEGIQLLHTEHILQAHQRHGMNNFFKLTQSLSANPLCRRIRLRKLRIGFFQILQLPKQAVIFEIRHIRVIQDIIAVIRLCQQTCQFFDSIFWIHNFLRFVKKCSEHLQQSRFPQRLPHYSQ